MNQYVLVELGMAEVMCGSRIERREAESWEPETMGNVTSCTLSSNLFLLHSFLHLPTTDRPNSVVQVFNVFKIAMLLAQHATYW